MPELPEVETVRRSLEQVLPKKSIVEILVREPRLRSMVDEARLNDLLLRRKIIRLTRRAKYIIVHFAGGSCLILHLGMTGQLLILSPNEPLDKHDHVIFALSNGQELRFRDPRRFGVVCAVEEENLSAHEALRHLGVEPLTDDFTPDYLFQHSRQSKRPVKNFVMDQQVVVGVGNIYASESLFLAGIHPWRAAGRISLARWQRLHAAIQQVLQEAIALGGTTIDDFRNSDGTSGYFQQKLRAYARTGEPCVNCQTPIRSQVLAGRSTFYCSKCQR
ncbi:MAG: bifunctional DNA-formamidopyrimidine glycosylase/DNA-(apurinic or apyrimidinic site) lyase [Acidobacteria bacterium]|nr:bifunctional DNA-formamidopyrimidine glycosylase/DNA-(apurinic or apyrimidinic site) lyase [Acidobacteriota bacterium]